MVDIALTTEFMLGGGPRDGGGSGHPVVSSIAANSC
jgi:hypothetical protein